MAVLAHIGRIDVRRVLARCVGTVVTAEAVIRNIDVIEVGRDPRGRRVAVVAIVTARDVSRVLAGGHRAVMAGEASSDDLRVINHIRRRPCHVVVAVLADVGRIDVRWMLARRRDAVVARDAGVRDRCVIKIGRYPGHRGVAIVAIVTGGNVVRVLASCGRTVMA